MLHKGDENKIAKRNHTFVTHFGWNKKSQQIIFLLLGGEKKLHNGIMISLYTFTTKSCYVVIHFFTPIYKIETLFCHLLVQGEILR